MQRMAPKGYQITNNTIMIQEPELWCKGHFPLRIINTAIGINESKYYINGLICKLTILDYTTRSVYRKQLLQARAKRLATNTPRRQQADDLTINSARFLYLTKYHTRFPWQHIRDDFWAVAGVISFYFRRIVILRSVHLTGSHTHHPPTYSPKFTGFSRAFFPRLA